jgi:hypothetical protein
LPVVDPASTVGFVELGAKSCVAAACALASSLGCGDGTSGWILTEATPVGPGGVDSGVLLEGGHDAPFEIGVTPPGRFPRDPEDFAGACSPELTVQNRTSDSNWRLFRDAFPDLPEYVISTTKRCCALLYKTPNEVPRTRHLTLLIEDFQGGGYMQDDGDQTMIRLSSVYMRNIVTYGGSVRGEMGGILHYLIGIDYSWHNENPDAVRWLSEGIGEWVRQQAGQGSINRRRSGGTWTDGKETMGYFLMWLTERYPDAVYLLNQSLDSRDGMYWDERAFEYITGRTLPELWNAYQQSI